MTTRKLKYIYGPVSSWRLGRSLGIDLISTDKTCSFDCIYCQLGPKKQKSLKQRIFVPTKEIIKEFKSLPKVKIDFITFSGCGEPTLAKNLGEVIRKLRKITKNKIAVLTNASLMHLKQVRQELGLADFVSAKLDAADNAMLEKINKPVKSISLKIIMNGMKKFSREFPRKLGLQIMFCKQNKKQAKKLAELAREINPTEVEINTPTRKCKIDPLSKKEIGKIEKLFAPLKIRSVYKTKTRKTKPLDKKALKKRRPL